MVYDGSRGHLEGLGGLGRPKWELWNRLQERLGALLRRFGRVLSVQEVILRGDFEPKMEIDCGNADFLKSMLSLRREHIFGGPEDPKIEPQGDLKRSCEAKRAEEERKSA